MPRRATTQLEYRQRIQRAQTLLESSLDTPVRPANLAREACFSLHHFHRIFLAQTGESVMQQLRRLRLERAARRILNGQARLLDLALEAGYGSHEAFTRAFTEHFGTLPSDFRTQRFPQRQAPPADPAVAIRVETFAEVRVAGMRARGSYANVGATWQQLLAWAVRHGYCTQAGGSRERGLVREEPEGAEGPLTRGDSLRDSPPCLYGLCPDDPAVTDESQLRFDACVVIDSDPPDHEAVTMVVPAGSYAVGLHVGPYDRLHETYLQVIGHWFPMSGYEPAADAVVEHYLNSPATTPPDQLRTEVRVRIAD